VTVSQATTVERPIPKQSPPLIGHIDAVRGLACLLVVVRHVIGDGAATGLHLPLTSPWHYAMTSLDFIRMPLFTALSGYLYAGHRVTRPDLVLFWTKKLRRIAFPLVTATVILWLFRYALLGETEPLWHVMLFSYGHLWYLQALLLLFLTISVLDAFVKVSWTGLVFIAFGTAILGQAGFDITEFFSIAGAVYLLPHFLFGVLLRERADLLQDRSVGLLALGIVAVVLTAQQLGLNGVTPELPAMQLSAVVAGMAMVVFLLQRFPDNAFLAGIGRYAYTIYLWHMLSNALARETGLRLGLHSNAELFVFCLTTAIGAPILLHSLAARVPMLCLMLTGSRGLPRPHRRSANAAARPAAAKTAAYPLYVE
jgi:glucans biosynthesis protein C